MAVSDIFLGNDLVEVSRILLSIDKIGQRFIDRIYTKHEQEYCNSKSKPEIHYAGRFAAKEAFSKALGTGISKGINFNEIIVLNEKSGKPYIKLIDNTKKIVEKKFKRKIYNISLSIADEKDYAVAFVTISI